MASGLIRKAPHEAENPIEVSLRESFQIVEPKLRPPFPLTIPSQEEYSNLNRAILYGILCESHLANVHIKHLHGIVTDGYGYFTSLLIKIVNDMYGKLFDSVKRQLIWVAHETVHVSAVGFDGLMVAFLRQIAGGDFSEGNLWLCFEMVSLFLSKWESLLEEDPSVLTFALYVFLRLLADHCRVSNVERIEALKRIEIEFCVRMLREQFCLCLKIGRDLLRLLQDLVHKPEFCAIWKDLLLNPSSFRTEGFADITQIYRTRTSSRYFLLRITPEMESQVRFLLTHVKLGSQKRYQVWFTKKFLATPERETLLIDMVRFICCAHHPSNEIIQSDVIQRWAVIGWLLKSGKKTHVEANMKISLFYDWLFFDDKVDNIMNLEPAILLMVHSIPKYIDMTHSLLEFLFILLDNYDLDRKAMVLGGISSAFHILVRKGVVQSLDVLVSCDMLSPYLRERLRKLLPDLQLHYSRELHDCNIPCNITPLFLPSFES
ncbi:embryo defective [Forsythia ovata]|uniref:Embryo defective n=1 Tax=Forsythia ovata TaxID=205694 RepID=A0ABD1R2Z4_9LAMI